MTERDVYAGSSRNVRRNGSRVPPEVGAGGEGEDERTREYVTQREEEEMAGGGGGSGGSGGSAEGKDEGGGALEGGVDRSSSRIAATI